MKNKINNAVMLLALAFTSSEVFAACNDGFSAPQTGSQCIQAVSGECEMSTMYPCQVGNRLGPASAMCDGPGFVDKRPLKTNDTCVFNWSLYSCCDQTTVSNQCYEELSYECYEIQISECTIMIGTVIGVGETALVYACRYRRDTLTPTYGGNYTSAVTCN